MNASRSEDEDVCRCGKPGFGDEPHPVHLRLEDEVSPEVYKQIMDGMARGGGVDRASWEEYKKRKGIKLPE